MAIRLQPIPQIAWAKLAHHSIEQTCSRLGCILLLVGSMDPHPITVAF